MWLFAQDLIDRLLICLSKDYEMILCPWQEGYSNGTSPQTLHTRVKVAISLWFQVGFRRPIHGRAPTCCLVKRRDDLTRNMRALRSYDNDRQMSCTCVGHLVLSFAWLSFCAMPWPRWWFKTCVTLHEFIKTHLLNFILSWHLEIVVCKRMSVNKYEVNPLTTFQTVHDWSSFFPGRSCIHLSSRHPIWCVARRLRLVLFSWCLEGVFAVIFVLTYWTLVLRRPPEHRLDKVMVGALGMLFILATIVGEIFSLSTWETELAE